MGEYKKKRNLDLYDLCIIIDSEPKNSSELAEEFGISRRQIWRKVNRLKRLGIVIETNSVLNPFTKDNNYFYELKESIESVLKKLDDAFKMPELYQKSSLPEKEQQEIIKKLIAVNNNSKHYPEDYFKNFIDLKEKLKVIIPFCLENILFKEPEEITEKDIINLGLSQILKVYFDNSILKFLQVSYPWLKKEDRYKTKIKAKNKFMQLDLVEKLQRELGFNPEEVFLEKRKLYEIIEEKTEINKKNIIKFIRNSKFYNILEMDKFRPYFRFKEKNIKKLINYCRGKDLNLGRH